MSVVHAPKVWTVKKTDSGFRLVRAGTQGPSGPAGAAGPNQLLTGKTLWVQTNGTDGTAVPGDEAKPYLTPAAAWAASLAGDTVVMRPGNYTTAVNLFKAGVVWHFEKGATLGSAGPVSADFTLFDAGATPSNGFAVTGHGTFANDTDPGDTGSPARLVVRVNHAGSDVLFEADSVSAAADPDFGSAAVASCSAGRLTTRVRTTTGLGDLYTCSGGTLDIDLDVVTLTASIVAQVTGGTLTGRIGSVAGDLSSTEDVVKIGGGRAVLDVGRLSGGANLIHCAGGESVLTVGELADVPLHHGILYSGGDHIVRIGRVEGAEVQAVLSVQGTAAGTFQLHLGYADCQQAVLFTADAANKRVELWSGHYACADVNSVTTQGGAKTLYLMGPVYLNGKPPGAGVTLAGQSLVYGDGSGLTGLVLLSGKSVLATHFTFPTNPANGVFVDTGLSVALPAAGTYWLFYNVRGEARTSSGTGFLAVRLWDVTAGAAVADTNRLLFHPATTTGFQMHSAYSERVVVTAASTIRLEASRNDAPGWAASNILSDANGKTTLEWVKTG